VVDERQYPDFTYDSDVIALSHPPSSFATSHKAMYYFGNYYRCEDAETSRKTMNCGVAGIFDSICQTNGRDMNPRTRKVHFVGKLQEIFVLDYGTLRPCVMKCKWVEPVWQGPNATMKKDEFGFTLVKIGRIASVGPNSFAFPAQVNQVFFSRCPKSTEWVAVLNVYPRARRVEFEGEDIDRSTEDDPLFIVQEREPTVEDYAYTGNPNLGTRHLTAEEVADAQRAVNLDAEHDVDEVDDSDTEYYTSEEE